MIDNVNFDRLKKNSFKLIGTLALSGILVFNLTGCINNNEYIDNNNNVEQEEVIVKAPCKIDIVGEENYYKDGKAPHFTIFKKTDEGKWNIYAPFTCDGEEKSTSFSEGEYLLYSEDIGEIEFSVDNVEEEYSITVDYNNKTLNINNVNDNSLGR